VSGSDVFFFFHVFQAVFPPSGGPSVVFFLIEDSLVNVLVFSPLDMPPFPCGRILLCPTVFARRRNPHLLIYGPFLSPFFFAPAPLLFRGGVLTRTPSLFFCPVFSCLFPIYLFSFPDVFERHNRNASITFTRRHLFPLSLYVSLTPICALFRPFPLFWLRKN